MSSSSSESLPLPAVQLAGRTLWLACSALRLRNCFRTVSFGQSSQRILEYETIQLKLAAERRFERCATTGHMSGVMDAIR